MKNLRFESRKDAMKDMESDYEDSDWEIYLELEKERIEKEKRK